MANYTTNYNLKKPLGSELYNVAVQNENMDLIDAAMKANADAIAKDEEGIAYRLGNTNTTGATLAVGTYVYVTGNTNGVSNGMYKVTTAIAANGSLTTSNLGPVPGGIGNALNSKITRQTISNNAKNDNVELGTIRIEEIDEIISITFIDVKTKQDVAPQATLIVGSVPSGYRPLTSCFTRGGGAVGGVGHDVGLVVYASGEIQIQNRGSNNSRMYANGNIIYFKNTL